MLVLQGDRGENSQTTVEDIEDYRRDLLPLKHQEALKVCESWGFGLCFG